MVGAVVKRPWNCLLQNLLGFDVFSCAVRFVSGCGSCVGLQTPTVTEVKDHILDSQSPLINQHVIIFWLAVVWHWSFNLKPRWLLSWQNCWANCQQLQTPRQVGFKTGSLAENQSFWRIAWCQYLKNPLPCSSSTSCLQLVTNITARLSIWASGTVPRGHQPFTASQGLTWHKLYKYFS